MFLKELICRLINLISLGRGKTERGLNLLCLTHEETRTPVKHTDASTLFSHTENENVNRYKCCMTTHTHAHTHSEPHSSPTESLSSTLAARQRAAKRLQAWVSGKVELKVLLYFFFPLSVVCRGKERLPMWDAQRERERESDQQGQAEQEGKCLVDLILIFASQRGLILQ